MNWVELFYLMSEGEGRWIVRHQITDALAGSIIRTGHGFVATDDDAHDLGGFSSIDEAIAGLYATA